MQSLSQNHEKELLKKVAQGDEAAFTILFNSYHHTLGAFIFGISKSKEIAEEITLDVFLKIWMAREALTEVKDFKAFLFTVSRNAAISVLRKIIRERKQQILWIKDPSSIYTESVHENEGYLTLVDDAINQLSPQRKKIFILSRQKGLKYKEIADSLGISRFTVRAHIQQAINSIVQYVKSCNENDFFLILSIYSFFYK